MNFNCSIFNFLLVFPKKYTFFSQRILVAQGQHSCKTKQHSVESKVLLRICHHAPVFKPNLIRQALFYDQCQLKLIFSKKTNVCRMDKQYTAGMAEAGRGAYSPTQIFRPCATQKARCTKNVKKPQSRWDCHRYGL